MRDYFKRLKGHPGVGVATLLTAMGFLAGATNKTFADWYMGGLFGLIFAGVISWTCVLLSNIKLTPKKKGPSVTLEKVEVTKVVEKEEWTPVPGYEKYYIQNENGKVKSLGKEFDFQIDSGSSEEMAAWLTMKFLKGYYSKDSRQTHNIEQVIEVMEKNGFHKRIK